MDEKETRADPRVDALPGANGGGLEQARDDGPDQGENQDVVPEKIYPSDPTGVEPRH